MIYRRRKEAHMLRSKILAAVLIAPLQLAWSQERAPELPDLAAFRDSLKAVPVAEAPAAAARRVAIAPGKAACAKVDLDGGQISGRAFSTTMDVADASGKNVATLETEGRGRVFKSADGSVIAKASEQEVKGGRIITVTGCSGETIATIVESDVNWRGDRSFVIKDAAGAVIGQTGVIDYLRSGYKITGPSGVIAEIKSTHWFFDRVSVTGPADSRIVVMLKAYNNEANARESLRRNQERERGSRDRRA